MRPRNSIANASHIAATVHGDTIRLERHTVRLDDAARPRTGPSTGLWIAQQVLQTGQPPVPPDDPALPASPAADNVGDHPLLPVAEVAAARLGRRPSPATVWRWIRRGNRGGKLRAFNILGGWRCSRADFDDFLARQTAAAMKPSRRPQPDAEIADDQLRAQGLL